MVNARIAALTLFLIGILTQTLSGVSAANTTITNLSYSSGPVSSGTTRVSFDLAYSGLMSAEGLIGAIISPATSDIANGTASSTPDQCISLAATQDSGKAACLWRLKSSSGTEHLTFNIQFPSTHIQAYDFEAVATIVTSGGNLLGTSQETFSIMGGTTFELTVDTTYPVALTIDGSASVTSPVQLTPGDHVISVPTVVQVNNSSRLRFDHWDDGSTQPNRTVNLQSDTTIEATFVPQYFLSLNSPPTPATGVGWYDMGSTAQFSVPSAMPMPGLLGTIGARLVFKGWYENGERVTAANIGTVGMLEAHTLIAKWTPDYTIPVISLAVIAAVAQGSAVLVSRRRTAMRRRKRKGKRRRTAGQTRRKVAR